MTTVRRAGTALAAAITLLLAAAPVAADQHLGADLDDDELRADAEDDAIPPPSPTDPGPGDPGPSDPGPPTDPYIERRIIDYYLDQPCADGHVNGAVRYVEVDPESGEERILYETIECVPIPGGSDDGEPGPPPPAPPPPPDATTVRHSVSEQLPAPMLAVNPHPEGLTGLESWFWYADDGASTLTMVETPDGPRPGLEVTATAGAHSITATAWIIEYRWETGDGASYASSTPGSPDDPAVSHLYEVKDTYTVTTATVWTGSYTWTSDGASGSGDLGSVTKSTDHPYVVIEARAVLTP